MNSKETYYISSGRDNKLYTLRVEFTETGYRKCNGQVVGTYPIPRDYYVKTLAKDLEEAKKKAEEHVGYPVAVRAGELFTIKKRKIDWTVMQFGKHAGEKIDDLVKTERDYCLWVAGNFAWKKKKKNIDYIQELLKGEYELLHTDAEIDLMVRIASRKQYAYLHHQERQASEHVGNIGERLEMAVKCERKVEIESHDYYGRPATAWLILFVDGEGNKYKWFTSSWKHLDRIPENEIVKIRGTVKSHEDYKGTAQTQLTRVFVK